MDEINDERVVAMLRLPMAIDGIDMLVAALEKIYGKGLRTDFQGSWMRILLP